MKILYLEDDPNVRRVVGRALRLDGAEVVEVCCCEDARGVVDCVLGVFDIELPDGDGVELAKELVQAGQLRAVVFLTGRATERAAGVGELVVKGSSAHALRAAVDAALSRLGNAGR